MRREGGILIDVNNNAIKRLHQMLSDAKIPHKFDFDEVYTSDMPDELYAEHMGPRWAGHIEYPSDGENRRCSVIEGYGTYEAAIDLLGIMGLLSDEELLDDAVAVYLDVDDVFGRIKNDWEKHE